MFNLIKQVFIVLLSFISSLATKCESWNEKPCMIKPTRIDMLFLLSLNIIHSWLVLINVVEFVMSYHQKYVFQEKQKKNIKAFNMITNKNQARTMAKHISCDYKCKFNSIACKSNQKWNNETSQCECKSCRTCKKDYC